MATSLNDFYSQYNIKPKQDELGDPNQDVVDPSPIESTGQSEAIMAGKARLAALAANQPKPVPPPEPETNPIVGAIKNIPIGLLQGVSSTAHAIDSAGMMIAENLGMDSVKGFIAKDQKHIEDNLKELDQDAETGKIAKLSRDISAMVVPMGISLGLGRVGGAFLANSIELGSIGAGWTATANGLTLGIAKKAITALSGSLMGAQSGAEMYDASIKQGDSNPEALKKAAESMMVSTGLGIVEAGTILKHLPADLQKKIMWKLGQGGMGALTSWLDAGAQSAIDKQDYTAVIEGLTKNTDVLLPAFVVGGIMGGMDGFKTAKIAASQTDIHAALTEAKRAYIKEAGFDIAKDVTPEALESIAASAHSAELIDGSIIKINDSAVGVSGMYDDTGAGGIHVDSGNPDLDTTIPLKEIIRFKDAEGSSILSMDLSNFDPVEQTIRQASDKYVNDFGLALSKESFLGSAPEAPKEPTGKNKNRSDVVAKYEAKKAEFEEDSIMHLARQEMLDKIQSMHGTQKVMDANGVELVVRPLATQTMPMNMEDAFSIHAPFLDNVDRAKVVTGKLSPGQAMAEFAKQKGLLQLQVNKSDVQIPVPARGQETLDFAARIHAYRVGLRGIQTAMESYAQGKVKELKALRPEDFMDSAKQQFASEQEKLAFEAAEKKKTKAEKKADAKAAKELADAEAKALWMQEDKRLSAVELNRRKAVIAQFSTVSKLRDIARDNWDMHGSKPEVLDASDLAVDNVIWMAEMWGASNGKSPTEFFTKALGDVNFQGNEYFGSATGKTKISILPKGSGLHMHVHAGATENNVAQLIEAARGKKTETIRMDVNPLDEKRAEMAAAAMARYDAKAGTPKGAGMVEPKEYVSPAAALRDRIEGLYGDNVKVTIAEKMHGDNANDKKDVGVVLVEFDKGFDISEALKSNVDRHTASQESYIPFNAANKIVGQFHEGTKGIDFFLDSDLRTGLHEFGHALLMGLSPTDRAMLTKSMHGRETIHKDALKGDYSKWSSNAKERFATGIETMAQTGQVLKGYERIFTSTKNFLTAGINVGSAYKLGQKINPELITLLNGFVANPAIKPVDADDQWWDKGTLNQRVEQDPNLWDIPEQTYNSSDTSINSHQMPSSVGKIQWKSGTINADIGGGRFDNVTEHLAQKGVQNVIYDPFNRTPEHNADAVQRIAGGKADTATVNNVLNVIAEAGNRDLVIKQAANALKPSGTAHFLIYEGSGTGESKATSKGWQENRKTESYMDEIRTHFSEVTRKGNMIFASNSIEPVRTKGKDSLYQHAIISEDDPILDIGDRAELLGEKMKTQRSDAITKPSMPSGTEIDVEANKIRSSVRAMNGLMKKLREAGFVNDPTQLESLSIYEHRAIVLNMRDKIDKTLGDIQARLNKGESVSDILKNLRRRNWDEKLLGFLNYRASDSAYLRNYKEIIAKQMTAENIARMEVDLGTDDANILFKLFDIESKATRDGIDLTDLDSKLRAELGKRASEPKFKDYFTEFMFTNNLSNPYLGLANVSGNALWGLWNMSVSRPLSAGIDKLAYSAADLPVVGRAISRAFYGKGNEKYRTYYFRDVLPTLGHFKTALKTTFPTGTIHDIWSDGAISMEGSKLADLHIPHLGAFSKFQQDPNKGIMATVLKAVGMSPERAKSTVIKSTERVQTIAPYIQTNLHLMRLGDIFFNTLEYHRSMDEIIYREGLKLPEGERKTRAEFIRKEAGKAEENIAHDFVKDVKREALTSATRATFTDASGALGRQVGMLREVVWPMKIFTPFLNTMMNIAKRGAEMTPGLGLAMEAGYRKFDKQFDPNTMGHRPADIIAHQVEGMMAAMMLYALPDENVTGDAPTDPRARREFYSSGKMPDAIKIGNNWVSYQNMDPFGIPLKIMTQLKEVIKTKGEGTEAADKLNSLAFSLGEVLASQAFSRFSQYAEAKTAEQKLKILGSTLEGAIIPYNGFWKFLERQANMSAHNGQYVLYSSEGNVLAKTFPTLAKVFGSIAGEEFLKYDEKIDVWGKPIVLRESNMFWNWTPFSSKAVQSDIVESALMKSGYYPGLPAKQYNIGTKTYSFDPAVYKQYVVGYGSELKPKLEQVVTSNWFVKMAPEYRYKYLQKFAGNVRSQHKAKAMSAQAKLGLVEVQKAGMEEME